MKGFLQVCFWLNGIYDYSLELQRMMTNCQLCIHFVGMYVCLGPLKARLLKGCKRIISLDGCFLKGFYGGKLLSAVGIYGNESIYSPAWAVMAKENNKNW